MTHSQGKIREMKIQRNTIDW